MARNIEIKARARDIEKQVRIAETISNSGPELILQEDTFFNVPAGRLKLRVFADRTGELIQYDRTDSRGPSESNYLLYPTDKPEVLGELLANTLGIMGIVRKKRRVYLCGKTRIHIDQVEGLGRFIELEVVLEEDQPAGDGVTIAEQVMEELEITDNDLIDRAYIDLIIDTSERR